MKNKRRRSIGMRLLNSLCAFVLLGTIVYMFIVGVQVAAVSIAVAAFAGVAAPVVLGGEGILEIVAGIFEAILEGILGVFEAIMEFFSGLLS